MASNATRVNKALAAYPLDVRPLVFADQLRSGWSRDRLPLNTCVARLTNGLPGTSPLSQGIKHVLQQHRRAPRSFDLGGATAVLLDHYADSVLTIPDTQALSTLQVLANTYKRHHPALHRGLSWLLTTNHDFGIEIWQNLRRNYTALPALDTIGTCLAFDTYSWVFIDEAVEIILAPFFAFCSARDIPLGDGADILPHLRTLMTDFALASHMISEQDVSMRLIGAALQVSAQRSIPDLRIELDTVARAIESDIASQRLYTEDFHSEDWPAIYRAHVAGASAPYSPVATNPANLSTT